MSPVNLNEFRGARYSQYGEDGILEHLFRMKGVPQGYFCEFGAWDGQHLSNTFGLYKAGWTGCYIEGDARRFRDLERNIAHSGMSLVHAFVQVSGENTLDNILSRSLPEGTSLDVLSIDIDSDDLAIWMSLQRFRPRAIVIEFNPTIPLDVVYVNPPGKNRGNSARAIYNFGTSIGYQLVAATHCNLIMVDESFNQGQFCTFDLEHSSLRLGYRYFFGFDGTLMMTEPGTGEVVEPELFMVPWSSTAFPQPIPKPFRVFDELSLRTRIGGLLSYLSCTLLRPCAVTSKLLSLFKTDQRTGSRTL